MAKKDDGYVERGTLVSREEQGTTKTGKTE